jgi:hypothetical protein
MGAAVARNRSGQRRGARKIMLKRFVDSWIGARINKSELAMKTYSFTLIISGVVEITPDLADTLYAATDGDIELNQRDGVVFLEFERKAATLREAVTSAIREVEGTEIGVRVVRVESEAANVIAKINADLLGAATS